MFFRVGGAECAIIVLLVLLVIVGLLISIRLKRD